MRISTSTAPAAIGITTSPTSTNPNTVNGWPGTGATDAWAATGATPPVADTTVAVVTTTEVVLAKYSAAYLLYLSLWASTGGFFYILKKFAGDSRFLDSGPLLGGYLFVAVSGLLFIAVGVFASSLSRNQAVSGILCFTMLAGLIVGVRFLWPGVQETL